MESTSDKAKSTNYDISLERDIGERWMTMSTALTRAGQDLTLGEKRLVGFGVSTFDSKKTLPILKPGETHSTKIHASDYAEAYGLDINTAYSQMKSASEKLENRKVVFYKPASQRGGKPLTPTIKSMAWVGQADYQAGEGWVELHWWEPLLRHLTGLDSTRKFTQIQLQQASALRSVYSWRLLELLTNYKGKKKKYGWAEYTVEDFAVSMNATDKQQKNFAAIRRRIIEPAVKELIEKDGWRIEWEAKKRGRKVVSVRFNFERDPQQKLAL
jgi:plasmid replication initiation protein